MSRPPNALLLEEIRDMQPGFALDAGCGHGSEAIWLAASGWQVTAVDFSATALAFGRSTADAAGADVAERIEWVEGDLGLDPATRTPGPRRLSIRPRGWISGRDGAAPRYGRRTRRTLLLVGHRPIDPATGAPTPAAGQVQVSVDEAVEADTDPHEWDIAVAEERPRAAVAAGVDAVIRAIRVG